MKTRNARGFTLIEVVVAVAIGSMVIGGGMLMYVQGTKYFYKTTEHSSFRSEALIVLEKVAEDLEQLQVSAEKNPNTGQYYLIQPYELTSPYTIDELDPNTNKVEKLAAGKGMRFYRFHHIAQDPAPWQGQPGTEALPKTVPRMVGHKVEYTQTLAVPGDPSKGVNLIRNGEVVNSQPLFEVIFHKEPMKVAHNQVQGSPHAILTVTVVPLGGTFGNMDYGTMMRLRKEGSIVSRTFHLVGYESFYTSVLFAGLQKQKGNGNTYTGLDDLTAAVIQDAKTNAPGGLLANIEAQVGAGSSPPTHYIPTEVFAIEANTKFEDKTAAKDQGWLSVKPTPGRPAGAGEFSFEDNGAGPGSGSGGSGSASSASGSGSGSG